MQCAADCAVAVADAPLTLSPVRAVAAALHMQTLADCACRYGFIVMDGSGSLFGTLSGNTREVMHKFTVDLPKKHERGGQSALRFARLRMEKRHNYVRKVGLRLHEQAALQWQSTSDAADPGTCHAQLLGHICGHHRVQAWATYPPVKVEPATQRAQSAHLQLACEVPQK